MVFQNNGPSERPKPHIFVHVPKAAGSAILSILSRNYPANKRVKFQSGQEAEIIRAAGRQEAELIAGHLRFGVHRLLRRPASYFSITRDPIERYISDFYYGFAQPDHRFRDLITSGQLSLTDFLGHPQFCDPYGVVRQLSGLFAPLVQEPGPAEDIIQTCYDLVGLADRFDETVLLLAHIYGWAPPLYIPKNVSRLEEAQQTEREELAHSIRPNVEQFFRRDLDVHDFIVDNFEHAIIDAGPDFPDVLDAFYAIEDDIKAQVLAQNMDEIYYQADFAIEDRLPKFTDRYLTSPEYKLIDEYIHSDTPLRRSISRTFTGSIDNVTGGVVRGWALEYGINSPIWVTAVTKDGRSVQVMADKDRQDLLTAGFESVRHGFAIDLGGEVKAPADVLVYFHDTQIPLTPIRWVTDP